MAKIANADIIASLKEMTILELNELVKAIEEEFGVTASAPVAVAAAAAPVEEEAAKGPSEVTIVLTNAGQTKLAVIKAFQAITGLPLMEAKKKVDALPAVIKENISPAEADQIKAKLIDLGAEVEIK